MNNIDEEKDINKTFIINWIKYSFYGIAMSIISYKLLLGVIGFTFLSQIEIFSATWVAVLGLAMKNSSRSNKNEPPKN